MMFPCCNSYVYENIFQVPKRNGCFENLANALSQFSIEPDEIPNPLNIFMNTFVDSISGEISISYRPFKARRLDNHARFGRLDRCNHGLRR